MNLRLNICIIFFCLVSVKANSQNASKDTVPVLKLFSGFGEHTIRNKQKISFKMTNSLTKFNGTIMNMDPDTLFMKNGMKVPLHRIREIGYFGRQEKIIRVGALAMGIVSGILIYRFATQQDRGITTLVVVPAMTIALFTYPKRMFKVPQPWTLQVMRPIKSPFTY
ncbi:MAG: hypothetical protein SGJ10_13855 [Bacteroidota bacterium]|nr:hypothetical protein [Bacteroidota bacterium]